jgi:hypothetical protein
MPLHGSWYTNIERFLKDIHHIPHDVKPEPTSLVNIPLLDKYDPRHQPHVMLSIRETIRKSAMQQTLLWMVYKGVPRYVEPYEFKQFKTGEHLMAWCLPHNRIESFKPTRIQSVELSTLPFDPRYPVIIA